MIAVRTHKAASVLHFILEPAQQAAPRCRNPTQIASAEIGGIPPTGVPYRLPMRVLPLSLIHGGITQLIPSLSRIRRPERQCPL